MMVHFSSTKKKGDNHNIFINPNSDVFAEISTHGFILVPAQVPDDDGLDKTKKKLQKITEDEILVRGKCVC